MHQVRVVLLEPRAPPPRQAHLHHAASRHLLQVSHPLLALRLQIRQPTLLRLQRTVLRLTLQRLRTRRAIGLRDGHLVLQLRQLRLQSRLLPLLRRTKHLPLPLRLRLLLRLPLQPPVRRRRRQLRTQQPRRRLLQHPLVHQVRLVLLEPRAPPTRQAHLHHAARRHLLQVSHPLLALRLHLHRMLPRRLLLGRQRRALQLRKQGLVLCFQCDDLRRFPLCLRAKDTLALLQRRLPLLQEVRPPVHERRRQLRTHQPARRRRQHPHVHLALQVCVEPRLPALGQPGLHHPPHGHLLDVCDPLLALRLHLLRQRLRMLLLLRQDLDAKLLRQLS